MPLYADDGERAVQNRFGTVVKCKLDCLQAAADTVKRLMVAAVDKKRRTVKRLQHTPLAECGAVKTVKNESVGGGGFTKAGSGKRVRERKSVCCMTAFQMHGTVRIMSDLLS